MQIIRALVFIFYILSIVSQRLHRKVLVTSEGTQFLLKVIIQCHLTPYPYTLFTYCYSKFYQLFSDAAKINGRKLINVIYCNEYTNEDWSCNGWWSHLVSQGHCTLEVRTFAKFLIRYCHSNLVLFYSW